MRTISTRQWRIAIGVSRRQLVFAIMAGALSSEPVLAAPAVTSLTLSPSTIAGGTGSASTATVTLSEAAPAGGTVVTIGTSNPGLAASVHRGRARRCEDNDLRGRDKRQVPSLQRPRVHGGHFGKRWRHDGQRHAERHRSTDAG